VIFQRYFATFSAEGGKFLALPSGGHVIFQRVFGIFSAGGDFFEVTVGVM
jgi:hypothetical protein